MAELLAPIGSFAALAVALQSGADSVYFGVAGLSMRSGAQADFSLQELPIVVARARAAGAKAYLTLNVVVYDEEQERLQEVLRAAKDAGVDAVICWDLSVIQACQELELPIHVSTQASISNYAALKSYAAMGARAAVLARELSMDQVRHIIEQRDADRLPVRIECFVHGAMCIAVSGRCFMSQIAHGKSANRGECLQMCRRSYTVKDAEEDTEFSLEGSYVMSPKDLCAMPILDKLLDSGIDILKIEGRVRGPEYVKTVVESYKEAMTAHTEGKLDDEHKERLVKRMERVYNKGFSTGFYNGLPLHEWAGVYGNKSSMKKEYVGKVTNYYARPGVVEAKVESNPISEGDGYYLIGETTGVLEGTMPELWLGKGKMRTAEKGETITFKAQKARVGDKLYRIDQAEQDA